MSHVSRERLDALRGRFMSKVQIDENGCWLWTAYVARTGYGNFAVMRKIYYAHRVAYEMFVGPIPPGLELDHLCRVRHCVNPDHLEPVTRRENIMRGEGISAYCARKTHCKRGHEFTPENTYTGRADGSRECITCRKLRRGQIQSCGEVA